jgi:hypothetical protein
MDAPDRTLKQKFYRGMKEYLIISLYLWLILGLLVVYKSIVSSEAGIPFASHGFALLNALALGKIMLFGRELHWADHFKEEPLIYPTLFKSAAFGLLLGAFKILEEAGMSLYHGESVKESILSIGGGTFYGILAMIALLAVMLVPFFAFTELGGVIGESRLVKIFLESRHAAHDAPRGERSQA